MKFVKINNMNKVEKVLSDAQIEILNQERKEQIIERLICKDSLINFTLGMKVKLPYNYTIPVQGKDVNYVLKRTSMNKFNVGIKNSDISILFDNKGKTVLYKNGEVVKNPSSSSCDIYISYVDMDAPTEKKVVKKVAKPVAKVAKKSVKKAEPKKPAKKATKTKTAKASKKTTKKKK